jgi:hypothetical protein
MADRKRLENTRQISQELALRVKELIGSSSDYDLGRLMKKIEAQVIDIQHNLKLACRIAEDSEVGNNDGRI